MGRVRNQPAARPHRQAWAKVDDDTRAELARILRTKGQAKTADALKTSLATIQDVISGGTVRRSTADRITAAVRAFVPRQVAS